MNSKVYSYKGTEVEVTWDQKRCIHAKECVHGLPEVFDISKKPWIQPNKADPVSNLKDVIQKCPTGALRFFQNQESSLDLIPETNTIRIIENGPLYLSGDIRIVTMEEVELLKDTRIAMCRCGQSSNKPFCDNSHMQVAFEASEKYNPERLALEPSTGDGGSMQAKLVPNGPFVIEGNYEVVGEANTSIKTSKKMSFCRCGASDNKPFCDGSHKAAGLEG